MTVSAKGIDETFGSDVVPAHDELVDFDGFDELEKQYAVKQFQGKSQAEVYRNIKTGNFGSVSVIESLVVLKPAALKFYMAPYLKYFTYIIGENLNEDQIVHDFLFHINEHTRIFGQLSLSRIQREVLLDLSREILRRVRQSDPAVREWRCDLIDVLKKFESSLR